MTPRLLEIDACAMCWYFWFDREKDKTWCDHAPSRKRRIIPQTIDPSDEIPKWCPLPEAK